MRRRAVYVLLGLVMGIGSPVAAQTRLSATPPAASATAPANAIPAFDGPPPPVAPLTITRDDAGRATVRAVRLTSPLRFDGVLNEPIYETTPPLDGFIEIEPTPGAPASQRTEAWVFFDGDNVYVSARCWDTDMAHVVATELRHDNTILYSGEDNITFVFDTFYDRRNAVLFTVNPIGGRLEGQVTNERQYGGDWNGIWDVKTGRFEGGWTLEAIVPFKSLRYQQGQAQLWGFNMMRVKKSKNEISFLTRMPPARGLAVIQQSSLAATLVGLEVPRHALNLDVKPYATSSLTSDVTARPRVSNDPSAAAGLDAKYGLTQGITADLTINTDFAQVEADEQQVNLTRFSLFFPEKRDFFLENQGTFSFGGIPVGGGTASDSPILFYSRRIGLNQGRQVPLRVGGRATGRTGRYTLGILDIETGDEAVSRTRPTNFSVVRLKRDILRRSSIGVLATNRSIRQAGTGDNLLYGLDGTFAFFQNLAINTYWAQTRTDGLRTDDRSYRTQFDYSGDRYTLQLERLAIGTNFNPEVGFVRRPDLRRNSALFKFSPRLRASRPASRRIRKLTYSGSLTYIENGRRRLESREQSGEFGIEFANGDKLLVDGADTYEFLPRPFAIAPKIALPVGGYSFANLRVNFNMGQQHRVSANLTADYGTFYNGHKTTLTAARGRMKITTHLSLEPTYSLNSVTLVQGAFTTHLAGSRVTYTMTPRMFTSALVQYNSGTHSGTANVRLRWEYRPGSELFVVYNDERDTLARGFPDMLNRSLIIKLNRLLRF